MFLMDSFPDYYEDDDVANVIKICPKYLRASYNSSDDDNIVVNINDSNDNNIPANIDIKPATPSRPNKPQITRTPSKKVLCEREKYLILKPICDLITSRISQTGTDEFNKHVDFLNNYLNALNTNTYDYLYQQQPPNVDTQIDNDVNDVLCELPVFKVTNVVNVLTQMLSS